MTTIQQAPSGRQVPAGGKASPGQTAGSGDAAPKPIGLGELLRPVRRRLGAAILLQAVAAAVAVVPFAAVAELARTLLADGPADRDRAWAVAAVAAGALPVWLLPAGVAGALAHRADLDFQLSVRRRLVERLGRVPLGWFGDRGAAGVGKAVQHDVDAMHHLVAHSLLNLASVVVTSLVTLAYLFWVDWRMTLILLVPIALGIAMFARRITSMTAEMAAYDRALQRIVRSVVEFVEGIAVVKMFGQAGRAHRRYARAADDFAEFLDAWLSRGYRAGALSATALSPVTVLLTVLAGGTALIAAGRLDALDMLPFVVLGLGLAAPLQAMDFHGEDIETASAAAGRVGALLSAPELETPAEPLRPEDDGGGYRVELSGVEFAYDAEPSARGDAGRPVLSGIDLTLEPGTVTALVGASARARRPWRSCCRASSTRPRAPSGSAASTCATSRRTGSTGWCRSSCRTSGCWTRACATTSASPGPTRTRRRCAARRGRRPSTSASKRCPAATTRWPGGTSASPAGRRSGSPSRGRSSPTPRSWCSTRRPRTPTPSRRR